MFGRGEESRGFYRVLVSLQWLPWLCITDFYGKWRVEWFRCWKCSVHSLSVGAVVGMEFWARWAHRALWHASLWHMHESHHRPRNVPFELNDVFAIINAVPAIALFSYGFFNEGLLPGLCFGAGLRITVFGMAYIVAAAHQLHYADKFDGAPYQSFKIVLQRTRLLASRIKFLSQLSRHFTIRQIH
ncbi:hypothetical protein OIU77_022968 [Salix suchowensis]|uniref:beta-carotene 3-hydroxylase n=1 Tax=Salix suchowensis TaxID=1278906 RepID=A0ABQ9C5A5_9ROSI|nr:hypothetical protein OIU77_022968 [Salix suchowensis]